MTEPNDFTPHPSGLPVPNQPPRLPAPGHLVGRAQGVQLRTESDPYVADRLITVLGFRLAVADRPQPIEVELRGPSLTGTVRDGDWVEVPEQAGRTGLYAVTTVANLTTGVPVTAKGPTRSVPLTIAMVVFLVIVLVVFAFILINILSGFETFET